MTSYILKSKLNIDFISVAPPSPPPAEAGRNKYGSKKIFKSFLNILPLRFAFKEKKQKNFLFLKFKKGGGQ